jgi:ATP-dependent Clp protease ATP-binding subunit ClpB
MIFLTSNLGSQEMSELVAGGLGFSSGPRENGEDLDRKIYQTAKAAACRKFSPEFINRIDKLIVFRSLQWPHLEQILAIELGRVQQRIMTASGGKQFVLRCTDSAREFLLREGTDAKYGARHLRRSIERHLVCPLANLMATAQISIGDLIIADYDCARSAMTFLREDDGALVGEPERAAIDMAVVGARGLQQTYSANACAFRAAQN